MEVLDLVMGFSLCKMGCEGYLGNSLLHYAAQFGNVEMMKYIMDSGTPAGVRNFLGETPMHLAAGAHIRSNDRAMSSDYRIRLHLPWNRYHFQNHQFTIAVIAVTKVAAGTELFAIAEYWVA